MAAADHFHVGSGSNHKNEYRPRNPEDSLLYRTIAGHLETFLAGQQERGREVPQFVEREMRAYLSCGVLACGFLRLQCRSFGKDRGLKDKRIPILCRLLNSAECRHHPLQVLLILHTGMTEDVITPMTFQC